MCGLDREREGKGEEELGNGRGRGREKGREKGRERREKGREKGRVTVWVLVRHVDSYEF